MKNLILIFCFLFFNLKGQIPSERLSDWKKSGLLNQNNNSTNQVDIEDFGGGIGSQNNDSAIEKAILYLQLNGGGLIRFSQGVYKFRQSIVMRDSISLIGEGSNTVFEFNLAHSNRHCIQIQGKLIEQSYALYSLKKSDRSIVAQQPFPSNTEMIRLSYNDSALCFSNWAYGEIGSILKIQSSDSNSQVLNLYNPTRLNVPQSLNPRMQVIQPIQNVFISCLKIRRMDSTVNQTSHIYFQYAFNCEIRGVEFENSNFAHITFERSAHNLVYGSYFHDAFNYGGGGKGYGVVLQSASSDNKIENNIFRNLRHSILLQSGANGNVIAYNYSREPKGSEMLFKDISGDMVCHGNYPHHNLFEGNICQNIVVDNSHGKNGPFNTFFRNRAALYGIMISNDQDSQNFICNEIPDSGFLKGQFLQSGVGHLLIKNNVRGTLSGNLNLSVTDTSLFLNSAPSFLKSGIFKGIGSPFQYMGGSVPAEKRFTDSIGKTLCEEEHFTSLRATILSQKNKMILYPNPVGSSEVCILNFKTVPEYISIYSSDMKLLKTVKYSMCFDVSDLASGIYHILTDGGEVFILCKNE